MCDNNNLVNYHYGIYSKKRLRSDDSKSEEQSSPCEFCTFNIVICDAKLHCNGEARGKDVSGVFHVQKKRTLFLFISVKKELLSWKKSTLAKNICGYT